MTHTIKNTVLALAATFVFAAAAHAQTSVSSSWSSSSSSSSSSSWGVRPDGTSFSSAQNSSSSRKNASTTTSTATPFGVSSNTTSLSQQQSQANGFSQSNGPGGFRRDAFSNNSGSTSLVNQQRTNGLFGNTSDTRSFNSQFSNQNSISQGVGPSGVFDNRFQRNTGSTTVGRNRTTNSIFGPSIQAGGTRTVGFDNQRGVSTRLNSGGLFQNAFNTQNVTTGGTNFFNILP